MTTFDGNRLLNEKKEQASLSERIISATLCVITVLLAALIFVKAFWMRPFQIEGGSMLNTLQNEDWVIADRFAKPRVGDVVVLYNEKAKIIIIKRVIALAGETVYYDDVGRVYDLIEDENGKRYEIKEESYAYFSSDGLGKDKDIKSVTLAEDEIFVMGDNRIPSSDSRRYGPFKTSAVIGVVHQWVIDNRKNLKWLYPYI